MINATFRFGGDLVSIKVEGNNLYFFDIGTGVISTLEGLKFSKAGVLKEHPDLENNSEWKNIAIERLKKHIKGIEGDVNKAYYLKEELEKFGYEPVHYIQAGFRPKKFK